MRNFQKINSKPIKKYYCSFEGKKFYENNHINQNKNLFCQEDKTILQQLQKIGETMNIVDQKNDHCEKENLNENNSEGQSFVKNSSSNIPNEMKYEYFTNTQNKNDMNKMISQDSDLDIYELCNLKQNHEYISNSNTIKYTLIN